MEELHSNFLTENEVDMKLIQSNFEKFHVFKISKLGVILNCTVMKSDKAVVLPMCPTTHRMEGRSYPTDLQLTAWGFGNYTVCAG